MADKEPVVEAPPVTGGVDAWRLPGTLHHRLAGVIIQATKPIGLGVPSTTFGRMVDALVQEIEKILQERQAEGR